jgi:hypothetical protein
MTLTLFRDAFAWSGTERSTPVPVSLASDARLAEVEKHLDRPSDAFVDALTLLDRCLPPSFSA